MHQQVSTTLVTVVIPTYNRMPFLIEAINSVLAQTYANWELIIVDDESSDGTVAAIKKLDDPRIQLTTLPHQGLIGPLRNAGVKMGTGQWLAFLDSDDVWMPEKLELQLNALQQNKFECCYGGFELMDEAGKTIPVKAGIYKPLSGNIIREVLNNDAAVSIGSLMVSRKLFTAVGGFSNDPRLMYRDDYELALRLALHAEIIAVPDVLFRVREHEERGTNSVADAAAQSAVAYEVFIKSRPGIALEKIALKQYSHHMAEAAKMNVKRGKYWLAFQQLKKGFLSSRYFSKRKQNTDFPKVAHE